MLLSNPYVLIAVGVLLAASHGTVAVKSYRMGKDSVVAENSRLEEVERRTREAAQRAAAEEISKIEVRHVTIRQRLDREIIKEPVYTECRHTPDGLRLINEALVPGSSESAGDRKLSGADDARR